jgi:hypothetical protein
MTLKVRVMVPKGRGQYSMVTPDFATAFAGPHLRMLLITYINVSLHKASGPS